MSNLFSYLSFGGEATQTAGSDLKSSGHSKADLFDAVRFKTVDKCDELLQNIKDINVCEDADGKTPLHVVVRLGDLDWTDKLLTMGANPEILSRDNTSVLAEAERCCKMYPFDSDRKVILRLVRLAHELGIRARKESPAESYRSEGQTVSPGSSDQGCDVETGPEETLGIDIIYDGNKRTHDGSTEKRGRSDGTCIASTEPRGQNGSIGQEEEEQIQDSGGSLSPDLTEQFDFSVLLTDESFSRQLSQFRTSVEDKFESMNSMITALSQKVDALTSGMESLTEDSETMIDNASILGTAMSQLRIEVAGVSSKIEMCSTVVSSKQSENSSVKESDCSGSDDDEVGVVMDHKHGLVVHGSKKMDATTAAGGGTIVPRGQTGSCPIPGTDNGISPSLKDKCIWRPSTAIAKESERQMLDCCEALVLMSQCIGNSKLHSSLISIYKLIYLQSPYTADMLMCLRTLPVSIMVDFDNSHVFKMVPSFRDIDGCPATGDSHRFYLNCSKRKIYLGAKANGQNYTTGNVAEWLAIAITRLCIHLSFMNDCKPYTTKNKQLKNKYDQVVKEAMAALDQVKHSHCNYYIMNALGSKNMGGRRIALVSAISGVLVSNGHDEGVRILNKEFPSLIKFYVDHIVPKFKCKPGT